MSPTSYVILTAHEAAAVRALIFGDQFDTAAIDSAIYAIDRVLGGDLDAEDD